MKRFFILLSAVLAFAACTQNDVAELVDNRVDIPEKLTVGFEGVDDDTRIQLEAGKTVWTEGDFVSVFYKSNANQKWEYRGETGARVADLYQVDKGVESSKMDYVVVAYPYNADYIISNASGNIETRLPAVQNYAEDSYGVGDNFMVSRSEFTQFSLKSVCGWLKIQLTGKGQAIKSLTLTGNNEEQLAGLIYVDTATAEVTLASNMGDSNDNNAGGNLVFDDTILTELTLDCGNGVVLGEEATAFYLAVLPQTFNDGFTIIIEDVDGNTTTKTTTNSITIERNHIQPMATIEFEAAPVVRNSEIRYTSTTKVEECDEFPWSFDTFGANVVSNEWNSETGEGVITLDAEVTIIGEGAFFGCDNLTSITIPDSVTTIDTYAFAENASLSSIAIPDSMTTIGFGAFSGSGLTSVVIPDSVETIIDGAFYSCGNLESVTISSSATVIGEEVFYFCSNLTRFEGAFASEDGKCLVVDGTLRYFAQYDITEYTIPSSVETISRNAFYYCEGLRSITIPQSVTTIDALAFDECRNLITIYCLNTTPAMIKDSTFSGTGYPTIYVPAVSVDTYKRVWSAYADSIVGYDFGNGEVNDHYRQIRYLATAKVEANSNYPWSFDTFGANILSHDFNEESGKGVITFDDDVTTIGDRAFYTCDSLTSITIGDSVTTIGSYAFVGCSSLTNITIPDSVTTIGNSAFADCNSLISITIPDSVTTIEYTAFAYCYSLTSITIPDSVTTIGESAFIGCSNLANITLGDSVTTIGFSAFQNCDSLTSITIPDSVTTIGSYAFCRCGSLTSITIPDSVTTIGVAAFSVCGSLTEFNGKFASEDGRCLIVDGTLNSFAPAGLTSYTIPDSVTTIGEGAFAYCDSLTSVTIGDSVTTIGIFAFSGCSSLTEFNGKFASEDGRCLIVDGTLNSFAPAGLTSYTIPDSVTTIGERAFSDCDNLTSITIPDSVTTIGYAAFGGCDSLTSVYCEATTPPSLGGSYVLGNNASGLKIYVPAASVEAYKTAAGWSTYADAIIGYDFENGEVVEPETPTSTKPSNDEIWYTSSYNTNPYNSYREPFDVEIISNTYDSENERWVIKLAGEVTKINDSAFEAQGQFMTSITIPESVTEIGNFAFNNCFKLKAIDIPKNVTSIGNWAFHYCTSFTSVTIPNSVETIGDYAFAYCEKLAEFKGKFAADNGRCLIVNGDLNAYAIGCNTTQYTIPDGVVSLGERSFAGAVKLTEVVIPSSVNEVCSQAFQDCSSLASLYCESQLPPTFSSDALYGVASNLRIYVPAASVEAYKTAAGWSTYADAIVGYDFENSVVVE